LIGAILPIRNALRIGKWDSSAHRVTPDTFGQHIIARPAPADKSGNA
jgi:hypothetical protein